MPHRGTQPSPQADMEHMQEMLRSFREHAQKCHQYAEASATPSCVQLFHDLGYSCEAHVRSIEKCIEEMQVMQRSPKFGQWVQTHREIMEQR